MKMKIITKKNSVDFQFIFFLFIFLLFFQAQAQKNKKTFCCCIYCIDFLYFLLLGCHYSIVTIIILIFHPIYGIKKPPTCHPHSTQTHNCLFFFLLNIFGSVYIELRMGGGLLFYSLNWVMYNLHNDPLPFSVFLFFFFMSIEKNNIQVHNFYVYTTHYQALEAQQKKKKTTPTPFFISSPFISWKLSSIFFMVFSLHFFFILIPIAFHKIKIIHQILQKKKLLFFTFYSLYEFFSAKPTPPFSIPNIFIAHSSYI